LTIINKLRTIKQDLKDMETFITIRGEMMYLRFRPQVAQLEVRIYHFIWLIVLEKNRKIRKNPFFYEIIDALEAKWREIETDIDDHTDRCYQEAVDDLAKNK